MGRLHLVEFEDLAWFPGRIRNYMTDFLQYTANVFDFYKQIIPVLRKGLESIGTHQIVDLGSGGGGGWPSLREHLKKEMPDVTVILTDYYPNTTAFERLKEMDPDFFRYRTEKIDAMDVPDDLKGLRTQFLSLHHFRPNEVRKILQNAIDTRQPIAVFEGQQRTISHFIQFFFSPINVLLLTPFIRPFSLGRIFFTYLIPIVPLFVWWDGLVSVLRTYSKDELTEIIAQLDNSNSFEWEIDSTPGKPVRIYYLLGTPKA